MAVLIRIRTSDRNEFKKVIRTKKDYFVYKGDSYHINYQKAFFTRIWLGFIKITCLDYEKGNEEPIDYFSQETESKTVLKPHHVTEVIRKLLDEVAHFQLIVLIMMIISIILIGVNIYFNYSNNSILKEIIEIIKII